MDAVGFLKTIRPGGPWVVTGIKVDRKGIDVATFDDEMALASWIATRNGKQNLYWGVNPVLRPLSKKASREDVRAVEWLHVDVDARAGEPPEEELARIRRLLVDECPIVPPTAVVFSGGGYQAFWKLREPIPVDGNVAAAEGAALFNKQLEHIFGGDHCHNVDRLMRLPGTVNIPDAKKAAKGRTQKTASVEVFEPERIYDLSEFGKANGTRPTGSDVTGNVKRIEDVSELDRWNIPDRVKIILVQGHDPDNPKPPGKDGSRSAWLFDALCQLARAGVPTEVIYSIITDPDFEISASVLDKTPNVREYATRQIRRAMDEVEEPELRELNDRFFIVGDYGGRCVVVEEYDTRDKEYANYGVQRRDDFAARFEHRPIEVGKKTLKLGKWWLGHPKARRFDRIVFSPGGTVGEGCYNLWRGFAVEPREGDCSRFLEHVRENVAGEYAEWLLNWMARAVQQPGEPAEVAVVLRGNRGVGKSFFARQFGSLFGPHFIAISNARHLVGHFNSHLEDCVVLLADEAFYAGDKRHESVLKALVTERSLTIERKGYDLRQTRNHLHLVLCSNDAWVVPAGLDERRFLVLDVARTHQRDTAYFGRIAEEMERGGREALLHFLLERDLSGWDFRQAPDTATLTDQKLRSLAPVQRAVFDALATGAHPLALVDGESVFVVTEQWASEAGVSAHSLGREIGRFADRQAREVVDDRQRRGFWLPPLFEARRAWSEAHGLGGVQWPEDVSEWDAVEIAEPPF